MMKGIIRTDEGITRKLMSKNPNGLATMIAILQYKGGVGKSTVSTQLGMYLVRSGKKVLMVDTDQQRSLTRKFRVPIEATGIGSFFQRATMGQIIDPTYTIPFPHLTRIRGSDEKIGTLGIIAGDISVESYARTLQETFLNGRVGNINVDYMSAEDFFTKQMILYSRYYDYVIFDTAPGLTNSLLTRMVIRTVDNVIVPIDDIDALWGILDLQRELQRQTSDLPKQQNVLFAVVKHQPDTKAIHDYYMDKAGFDETSNVISYILKSVFGNSVCDVIVPERRSLRRLNPGFGRTTPYTLLSEELYAKLQKKRESFLMFCQRTDAMTKLNQMLKEFEQATNKYPVSLRKPKYQEWDSDEL